MVKRELPSLPPWSCLPWRFHQVTERLLATTWCLVHRCRKKGFHIGGTHLGGASTFHHSRPKWGRGILLAHSSSWSTWDHKLGLLAHGYQGTLAGFNHPRGTFPHHGPWHAITRLSTNRSWDNLHLGVRRGHWASRCFCPFPF